MATQYEVGLQKIAMLNHWYSGEIGDRNEATTRFMLIDAIFFDCLGWAKEDAVLEKALGRTYADYTFAAPRDLLILEAKREGVSFEIPAGEKFIEIPLPVLIRGNDAIDDAIRQAAAYCQSRGVPYGAVSNGHQLIAFIANRQDGVAPLEGRCLVFSSLQSMVDNFLVLWNCLSKAGVEDKGLERRLVGDFAPAVPPKLAASLLTYPGVQIRNHFQSDLKVVSDLVLEDIIRSHELERRFLTECYCNSGALSKYAMLSREILQERYAALFDDGVGGPVLVPAVHKDGVSSELGAARTSQRPLLIIGDVGVGKTTFLRHLMTIDAERVFENAITLFLDLGSQGTLALKLREFILDEIERQLLESHQIDVRERNFVHGIYNRELERFRQGIYGDLREIDEGLYRRKEIEYLEGLVQNQEQHLKKVLEHIERGHRKQIVLFLDNSDQRSDATQQEAFLIAQEFASSWPMAVFVTLRPETFHRSMRSGALSGYHPKAFTVSPPRVDLVIEKRLGFASKIANGEIPIQSHQGMLAKFPTLAAVVEVFMRSLKERRDLDEAIEHIAGGNVRLALDLVKDFMGSGHVDTRKIVEINEAGGEYIVPLHEFLRAVIFGDSAYYDPSRSPIANLFDVSSADGKEHFLLPNILVTLATWSGPGIESGFVETARLYPRMQALGFTPYQIDAALVRAYRHKLIETAARRTPQIGESLPSAVRVTTVGIYHVRRLAEMFTYFDAVIIDTPILIASSRVALTDANLIEDRVQRARIFHSYLNSQWATVSTSQMAFDWARTSSQLSNDIDRVAASVARLRERQRHKINSDGERADRKHRRRR